MRKDIILSGVGGQGILTIATIIGEAATAEGINLKQAEVHGMSQRGGDVQSNLRLSDETIYSDLIAQGEADLIISMEPMEALRYLPYLQEEGWVITSANPFKNIPDYPEEVDLMRTLESLPHVVKLEIEDMAKENSMPKCANVILLGMAAKYIEIVSPEQLRESIGRVFATKGEKIVEMNQKAFDIGLNAVKNWNAMKIFSEELVEKAVKELHIANLAQATIGDVLLVAQYLEKETGIPFIRMDQGSPGLAANQIGIEAEKAALDRGVGSQYPAAAGVPELKKEASRFVKAFLNLEISPRACVPTTGSWRVHSARS